ncbi:MAG: DUF4190 domain-containing protein [Pirellulaceae bacterium]|nr:DUF4190 domain-containing protein [Pirellulaceae bacterium]
MTSPTPPIGPGSGGHNPFSDRPPTSPGQPTRAADPFAPGQFRPAGGDIGDDPAMRWVLPVGQSFWAIASGYLGLLSLAFCFLGPFAVLTGIVAIREMRANPRMSGWGRAIVGIVLGSIGSLFLVGFIIALAVNP